MHLARRTAVAAAALACAVPARAQELVRGRVLEHVQAETDTSKSYALYLPSTWTPERRWPVLIVFDPGAHAVTALERFRDAAERRGWVVMASRDTRNGGGSILTNNDAAVNAMLADAQRRLSVDTARIYLAGMSGMARYAWLVASGLDGHVAGLIGASAGFPRESFLWIPVLRQLHPFPYFGTAGSADFNREELEEVDSALDATAFPHRLAEFAGDHGWPPADVAARAVDWLQLQAIRAGTAPRDTAFVAAAYAAALAHARALEAASPLDAAREYRAIVADFTDLADVSGLARRADALARNPAAERERARRAAIAGRVRDYQAAIEAFTSEVRASPDGRVRPGTLANLKVDELRREQQDSARDLDAAHAATRMLTTLSVAAGGVGGEQMRASRWANAAAALEVALRAHPDDAPVCRAQAHALAQLGRTDDAFAALRCAVAGHAATRAELDADRLLAPLRSDPRFAEIAARAQ